MKVVILAGGLGTRLGEETGIKPKPMVEIGGKPILWHIMKIYSYYGFNDFIILTGYLSHIIKNYFTNYYERYSDITVDMRNDKITIHKKRTEPWKVTLLYTGADTMTGGRLLRAKKYIGNEPFLLTYGDGVSDVNIKKLLTFHKKNKKICTVTAVQLPGRFGSLTLGKKDSVSYFKEKPISKNNWINGGFFVCEPKIFDFIKGGDSAVFEKNALESLAKSNQLVAYKHNGFWQSMDVIRDKITLTKMWEKDEAPWAVWNKKEI